MKKKMRIATMVSAHFTTPPPPGIIYAPMDIAVEVSQGLQKKGHEVTFFAPKGSRIDGVKMVDCGLEPLRHGGGLPILRGPYADQSKIFNLWDQFLIAEMYHQALAGNFDLLHIHPADRALPLGFAMRDIPTIYTLHDPIYPWRAEIFQMFSSSNQYYVSISEAQRKPAPKLNYLSTVYNGVDTHVEFSEKSGDYLLFVGRLIREKGVEQAIEVAQKTGEKLIIIGAPNQGQYWDKNIKPYLSEKIKYVGALPRQELAKYYCNAKATLILIQWEEPFGLVMTESMATGTPVIALRHGSAPEVVAHGETGFVVDTLDEMVEAVKHIGEIDRKKCRERVEKYFSIERMVDGYEEGFLSILN